MNDHIESGMPHQQKKILHYENGRLYFSKDTERKFFFVLTMIMLLLGVGFKLGIWQ